MTVTRNAEVSAVLRDPSDFCASITTPLASSVTMRVRTVRDAPAALVTVTIAFELLTFGMIPAPEAEKRAAALYWQGPTTKIKLADR